MRACRAGREATARRDPSLVRLAGDRRGRAGQLGRVCARAAGRGGVGAAGTELRERPRKINRRQCEAAHTSSGIGELLVMPSPACALGASALWRAP